MEKRTILAFALSFLVLILWAFFFSPGREQMPPQDEMRGQETPKELAERPPAPGTPASQVPMVTTRQQAETAITKINEREIEVQTPLYHAVFSNVGPTIKSFRLKKYRQTVDPDSPLIELVDLDRAMGDFLTLRFSNASIAQKSPIICDTDLDSIHLSPESQPKNLAFQSVTADGLSRRYTFRFFPDMYRIDLDMEVFNQSASSVSGNYTATIRKMPPEEKKGYYSYVGLAILLNDQLEEIKLKKALENKLLSGNIQWLAYEDDFFISAVIPDQISKGTVKAQRMQSGLLEGTFIEPSTQLHSSQRHFSHYTLYFGPRELGILKELDKNLDQAIDFGWTDIIAKPLLYLLRFFNRYIHNYGVSIIMLTILVKIIFWPLTHKSYKSMKEMQKLQPRLAKIREKHKNDRQKVNQEMMALYKTYKVNPMSGCLPMIIQIPVFFALFRILGSAIELRHAPFMLWINDLSAPDRLFHFSFQIPFMKPPYGIPILTLLMGASMFIQQKMTPTPGDPAQAKIMMFLPIIFTFMFINFPSGLVLYWFVSNLITIGQQYRIHK